MNPILCNTGCGPFEGPKTRGLRLQPPALRPTVDPHGSCESRPRAKTRRADHNREIEIAIGYLGYAYPDRYPPGHGGPAG